MQDQGQESPIILVVEDDRLILGMVEEALIAAGFQVARAASGEEAVTLLKGNPTKYRALVSDINLIVGSTVGRSPAPLGKSIRRSPSST